MYNHTKKRASQWLGIIIAIIMIMKVEAGTQQWYASKLETKEGRASPVSLQALTINDQRGSQDSWNRYVEFYGSRTAYKGVFTFDLAGCNVANVHDYQLHLNFKGPTYAHQQWTLEYYVPANQSWTFAGNNKDASNWYWTLLSFKGTKAFSSLVGSDGKLQLRLSSTKSDDCDLDYLAITTSTDSEATVAPTTPATVAPTTPATVAPTIPATASPSLAPTRPTTTPTQKPTTAPTVTPTQKPTTTPTQKPTTTPTQKPTTAPTVPPTQKPTTTPTQTPTQKPTTTPTQTPTQKPTTTPTVTPTQKPTTPATAAPSVIPSQAPGGRLCPAGQIWAPAPGTTWQWQLTGSIDQTWDVQMYDIDLFDSSASVINSLHSKGRAVICYFSTQYEDWRPDASKFTSDVLGNNLDDWPGERFVDIRSSKLRQIMTERLDLAVSKGCDGVEPDNVDGYANNNGLGLTAANQLDYNKFLAQEAHKRGLSIGLKNDLAQVAALVTHFDWALNEQCNQYNECNYLNPFVTAGKAVFGVDYSGTASKICPTMVTAQFSWLMKDLSLGAKGTQCCTYASNGCAKASYRCITY